MFLHRKNYILVQIINNMKKYIVIATIIFICKLKQIIHNLNKSFFMLNFIYFYFTFKFFVFFLPFFVILFYPRFLSETRVSYVFGKKMSSSVQNTPHNWVPSNSSTASSGAALVLLPFLLRYQQKADF